MANKNSELQLFTSKPLTLNLKTKSFVISILLISSIIDQNNTMVAADV